MNNQSTIEVLMFAAAKEMVGDDRVVLQVQTPITSGDLLKQLTADYPSLASLLPSCRLAVDQTYVDHQAVIQAGSEVALIPPVSGG